MSATYADDNDIKKIVSLCDEVEELLKQKKDHTQKDIEFHTAIAMGSKNLIIQDSFRLSTAQFLFLLRQPVMFLK